MTRGSRGRGRGTGSGIAGPSPRKTRGSQKARPDDDGVPTIFKEMLIEDAASSREGRSLKRRKVAGSAPQFNPIPSGPSAAFKGEGIVDSSPAPASRLQTVTDDSESSESEVEWEDVEIEDNVASSPIDTTHHEPSETLSITINTRETPTKRARTKKRPISSAERAMRMDVHKMHVMYLLYYGLYRNNWCNDRVTQVYIIFCVKWSFETNRSKATLKKLVQPRIIKWLNPDPSFMQSQRSTSFLEGLKQVCEMWYLKFSITAFGLRRPRWIVEKEDIGKVSNTPSVCTVS
jgi:xeroderma pigmentosum group C-complementing protein